MINPQIIEKDGEPVFAVIPYAEWLQIEAMMEAVEDIRLYDEARARGGEQFPRTVMDSILAGEHPIKVYREHRRLTQRELAERLGVAPLYLSQIETGRRRGSTNLLRKIARTLSVTLDLLVTPLELRES
jgi:DNA-binding XRE family transcriptional regulator